jgi:hypothetical protein
MGETKNYCMDIKQSKKLHFTKHSEKEKIITRLIESITRPLQLQYDLMKFHKKDVF